MSSSSGSGTTSASGSGTAARGEFLHIVRELWRGEPVDFAGEHFDLRGAQISSRRRPGRKIYLGGSSPDALEVAESYADVYLTWGEPPTAVAEKLDRVRERAKAAGRELRFGIRLHVIARSRSAQAGRRPRNCSTASTRRRSSRPRRSSARRRPKASAGCRNCTAAGPTRSRVSPNLWAGVGLVRGGAGTALVGSHEEVADRIAEYHELGIDEFILSGYPHLEEAYQVGEGVMPVLRRRGPCWPIWLADGEAGGRSAVESPPAKTSIVGGVDHPVAGGRVPVTQLGRTERERQGSATGRPPA